jgi:hypothetical protein
MFGTGPLRTQVGHRAYHAKTRKLWKHSARAASTIEIATNIRSP